MHPLRRFEYSARIRRTRPARTCLARMFLTFWCLLTLVLAAVLPCTTFAPAFGMRGPEHNAPAQWLQAHALYRGSSGITAVLEPIAVLAAAVLTVLLRDWRPALLCALAGAACLAVDYLVFRGITQRADLQIVQWIAQAPPSDWQSWRSKWHVSQRVRFVLQLTGFALLALATLISPLAQD